MSSYEDKQLAPLSQLKLKILQPALLKPFKLQMLQRSAVSVEA
jgi:hypothetical protein